MSKFSYSAVIYFFVLACSQPKNTSETNVTTTIAADTIPVTKFQEKHRPRLHFSPPAKWMNDPNGMFFYEGEYHLFYQHYPDSTVWGPMHWGHAISKDLVHWEHLPIALYPDSLGYIFSGSAVVDYHNTSGFGSADNFPIVAIFTYHDAAAEKAGKTNYQSQALAFSLDKGRTWKKYEKNPVLQSTGIPDFRDPKVSWNDDAKKWLMTLAVKDHIEFYSSADLKKWVKLSEFGKTDGDHGGVWECPDLIKMKDENGNNKYVLLVSINPGAPNGGSGTQYFVGSFDGKSFVNDTPGKNAGWLDYGTDNYAGVTIFGNPESDGRRILIGWMSNWNYAQTVPTEKWRSAMTIPRTLSLKKINNEYKMISEPAIEIQKLIARSEKLGDLTGDTIHVHSQVGFPISTSMVKGAVGADDFTVELLNSKNQSVKIGYDKKSNRYFIDRRNSGKKFSDQFTPIMYGPRNSTNSKITFNIIFDVASVEVFFDDGATVLTAIYFPDEKLDRLNIYSSAKNKLTALEVHHLNSIWNTK